MIIFSFLLILMGMLILYKCSTKQITKAKPTQQQFFNRFRTQLRLAAFLCFLLAGSLLGFKYGSSIGFISWWIFATPVTFLLVLWVNDVTKQPQKKS
ncbi:MULTISPECIES: DUF1634 domain-containing protein [unclassified Acinetobacter]|uniref:DUF1634 domain-containing protein n=1 Tax=unclassified Acinetobacter TaxID=196816 RepID=UPI0024482C51|nr:MULTISPECIES: DUF1634 domain-containing protein [unclassified Acinetobacter]MDH0030280.1 DUF1634 domain-containing protein [Acinetobacter sp. GD04021]MDH0885848.1 DUF1634 domain-containing protein [Acinetobacter sp. GD03873]MDH1082468.1 DUF1634 domain-containing protein [Acinetobacter sp. GD03983]MDH2189140.1 DUF1634 domain-containing protein [Acinetobacter sp. GD03645]MDH2202328.1 DUF1634 domain-containing protein [Acinetobacter sp. GD03647]